MATRRSTLASIDAHNSGIAPPSAMKPPSKNSVASSGNPIAIAALPSSQPALTHRSSRQSLAPQRQSMAAGASTSSSAPAEGGPALSSSRSHTNSTPAAHRNSRQSVMGTSSSASGGGARNSTIGGQSAMQSTPNGRRSINGRQSLAPNALPLTTAGPLGLRPTAVTDPRPLRSRETMAEMKRRVHDLAEATGFSVAGYRGMTSLDSPTQAIFLALFRHIFQQTIDPSHEFATDAKKPEEEVMELLREYNYPAQGDITKMLLGSASSQQYWPKMLGILDWMVQLANARAKVPAGPLARDQAFRDEIAELTRAHAAAVSELRAASKSSSAEHIASLRQVVEERAATLRELEIEYDDEPSNVFVPFNWRCYERFWQGEDVFPDEKAKLEGHFQRKNHGVKNDIERLQQEKRQLEEEMARLDEQGSPLAAAESERDLYASDVAKFKQYREGALLPKIHKLQSTVVMLEEKNEECRKESSEQLAQHIKLEKQVASQEMSSEEFDRLSNERGRLTAEKEKLDVDVREVENQKYDLELAHSNMQQKLEERLKTFNPLAAKTGVLPLKVGRSSFQGVEEFIDELDLLVGQATLLHPGLDLKNDVRTLISSLRRDVELKQNERMGDKVERQERYDGLCERLHVIKEEADEVNAKLEVIRESIEEITRLTDEETRASNEDQLMKERKLQHTEQTGHRQLAEAESRLVELKAHAKHLQTVKEENLEKYKDELCAAVEECVALKARVGESLDEIGVRVGVDFDVRRSAGEEEEEAEEGEGDAIEE